MKNYTHFDRKSHSVKKYLNGKAGVLSGRNGGGGMEPKKEKIIDCKPLPKYKVWIKFADALEGEVDLNHLVGKGIFESWKSIDFFNNVSIDPISDTLAWGEEIDLDPFQQSLLLIGKN